MTKQRSDVKLSPHFTLFELTVTGNQELQEQNRLLSDAQMDKLTRLAEYAEGIRALCGSAMVIHSGYRSSGLNGATTGSSSTSQHPKCEAIDFHVVGVALEDTFRLLYDAGRAGKLRFGQLILESAPRSYGMARWIHISLPGTLDPAKVGQVMRMVADDSGKPHYEKVGKVSWT